MRDLIGVGLIDRGMLKDLPENIAALLEPLLMEMGR
jgi:hypothetical protein